MTLFHFFNTFLNDIAYRNTFPDTIIGSVQKQEAFDRQTKFKNTQDLSANLY